MAVNVAFIMIEQRVYWLGARKNSKTRKMRRRIGEFRARLLESR